MNIAHVSKMGVHHPMGSSDRGTDATELSDLVDDSVLYAAAKDRILENPSSYIFGPRVILFPGGPLSGKTTLAKRLLSERDVQQRRGYLLVKRMTTRDPRPDELHVESSNVQFVDEETFTKAVERGELLFRYQLTRQNRTGVQLKSFSRERFVGADDISPAGSVIVPIGRYDGFQKYISTALFESSPRILITTGDDVRDEKLLQDRARRRLGFTLDDESRLPNVSDRVHETIRNARRYGLEFEQLFDPGISSPPIDCVIVNDSPFRTMDDLLSVDQETRSLRFKASFDHRVRMIMAFHEFFITDFSYRAERGGIDPKTAVLPELISIGRDDPLTLYTRIMNAQLEKLFGQGVTYQNLVSAVNAKKTTRFRVPPALLTEARHDTIKGGDEMLSEPYLNGPLRYGRKRAFLQASYRDGVVTLQYEPFASVEDNNRYIRFIREVFNSPMRDYSSPGHIQPPPNQVFTPVFRSSSPRMGYQPLAHLPSYAREVEINGKGIRGLELTLTDRPLGKHPYKLVINPIAKP